MATHREALRRRLVRTWVEFPLYEHQPDQIYPRAGSALEGKRNVQLLTMAEIETIFAGLLVSDAGSALDVIGIIESETRLSDVLRAMVRLDPAWRAAAFIISSPGLRRAAEQALPSSAGWANVSIQPGDSLQDWMETFARLAADEPVVDGRADAGEMPPSEVAMAVCRALMCGGYLKWIRELLRTLSPARVFPNWRPITSARYAAWVDYRTQHRYRCGLWPA